MKVSRRSRPYLGPGAVEDLRGIELSAVGAAPATSVLS